MKRRVIFCDFDGTITESDNIVATIKHFDPPGWQDIVQDVLGERKSIRQGVGELFRLLPTSQKREVIDYAVSNAKIRAGFATFLEYCQENKIEFYVTSGGIDFFVYPLVTAFGIDENYIFCNGSDFSGTHIEITWPHPCDGQCTNDCGMCKATIMRRFPPQQFERIVIGDSVTDFEAAKLADQVFSRAQLTTKCRELNIAHDEFTTFHDIITVLQKKEQSKA